LLKKLGAGSSIGIDWTIENPNAVEIEESVFLGNRGWLSFVPASNFDGESRIFIGAGSYIGNDFVASIARRIYISEKVMISDRVFIGDCNHESGNPNIPIIDQGMRYDGDVYIGFGSWIGIGAVILPGVTVGRNCVIGANSVVVSNIPDHSIAVGSPARILNKNMH
jgi:acetyltransferase-like isoleucine patch superfamily enzyme